MQNISDKDIVVIGGTGSVLRGLGGAMAANTGGPVLVLDNGVVHYPFISQSEDTFLHEWRYTSQEPQSNYTKEEVAEKLHLNPNHPAFHEAGRLDNDIALTTGKPKRNRKALKAKRKAAKRRK